MNDKTLKMLVGGAAVAIILAVVYFFAGEYSEHRKWAAGAEDRQVKELAERAKQATDDLERAYGKKP